jgi:hypothetical protein
MDKPIVGKLFRSIYKQLIEQECGHNVQEITLLQSDADADTDDSVNLFNLVKEHLDEKQIKYLVE